MNSKLFLQLLDNIPFGIYILDDKGQYIYVNATYVSLLKTSKHAMLNTNVHDFITRGEIEYCVSDIVYSQKKRVSVFQEAYFERGVETLHYQHLIVSTPMINSQGDVTNIIAVCIPVDRFFNMYQEAKKNTSVNLAPSVASAPKGKVIAHSPTMLALLKNAKRIAETDASVLISGESGTGKDVLAQYIHEFSRRNTGKMVAINCASLPEELLESELFGYEKGAFTGASSSGKKGLIEEANNGTLFLDEINSLPLALQAKLLRVLETKTIQKLGSTKVKSINFRLICATNENLEKAVEEKRFRSDLYYRLSVISLRIPTLADRKEDIEPLTKYFLQKYNNKYDKKINLSDNAMATIVEHSWPGNVRELKNYVERLVIMSSDQFIEKIDSSSMLNKENNIDINRVPPYENAALMEQLADAITEHLSLEEFVDKQEKEYISYALEVTDSTYEAAEYLKTSQSLIMRRKKKYNI